MRHRLGFIKPQSEATLANHSQTVRQQLLASGADPDEVAADLHRHIEEELRV
jgi:hypothetical protein